jgi:AraC-like DNA-binding protein
MSVATQTEPEFFSHDVTESSRFWRDGVQGTETSLVVVCGGLEQCAPDYAIRRQTFPYYSIEFVAGGQGQLTLKGDLCTISPGTVFSYGPGVSQVLTTDSKHPLVKYFVDFLGEDAADLLLEAGLAPGTVTQSSSPHEVASLFGDLVRNGLRNSAYSGRICGSILEQLALTIAESAVPFGSIGSVAFGTYQTCRKHLEQHFLDVHSLKELAAACHVDPAYLCRLFKRYDHVSPYRSLLRLKMAHAARLLQQPGTLVKEVADMMGFTDPYHFTRAFKSVFGVAPTQYAERGDSGQF